MPILKNNCRRAGDRWGESSFRGAIFSDPYGRFVLSQGGIRTRIVELNPEACAPRRQHMQTDAQTVEPELGSRPGQSQAVIEPPGPPANLLGFLSFLVFGSPRDLTRIYIDLAREYGDVVRMGAGAWRFYFVSHPDHVQHVLQSNNHNYSRQSAFNEVVKQVFGNGLITSEGAAWRRRRKLAQPAFHRPGRLRILRRPWSRRPRPCWSAGQ